jgi:hypothetical protein
MIKVEKIGKELIARKGIVNGKATSVPPELSSTCVA